MDEENPLNNEKEGFYIKRIFTLAICSFLLTIFVPHPAKSQEQSIQEQIDASKSGETIRLKEGGYEGTITIDKPIHLVGSKGTTLIQKGSNPALTIKSHHVEIENLHIQHEDDNKEAPAILINGHHNSLQQIKIDTNSYGIQLDEANDNILSHISITGDKANLMKNRQNGIDIWKSHNNEIHHATISNVQDGIYIEKSNANKVHHNTAFESRYGYHLMFTKNTMLEKNNSYENISGMMVMGADGTVVKDNILTNNRENIQSLGLLVFDTTNAAVTENHIANNRIGIFIEDASDNELTFNNVKGNYIGMQFKGAENNNIANNAFVANAVQGQAKESANNHTNYNYWGDHFGLDITGDNRSDLTYKVDPFFLNITNEFPPFQLLFQSPGMVFLEQLIHTPVEEKLVDQSPLMENPLTTISESSYQNQFAIFLLCMSIFILSMIMIYLGVKIDEKV